MTSTPTIPRKNAPGQGRKKKAVPGRRFLLPIWCTDEQHQYILDNANTEERATILLWNIGNPAMAIKEGGE